MRSRKSVSFSIFLFVVSFVFFAYSSESFKEMEFKDAKLIKRNGSSWSKRGRIVGEIKNPQPDMVITFYLSSGKKPVYTYKTPGKLYIYRSCFLAPGHYTMVVKSPGYTTKKKVKIKVVARHDTKVDIIFGTRVFVNR